MKWTRLRTAIEERFAPSIAGRLVLRQARYRNTREEAGRIWFAIDKREVAAFATYPGLQRRVALTTELMDANGSWGSPAKYGEADKLAQELLEKRGEQNDYVAKDNLEQFLSMSIDEALTSANPIHRALAIADRRVGKRRLITMRVGSRAHPLVREVYRLRCEAEGVRPNKRAS